MQTIQRFSRAFAALAVLLALALAGCEPAPRAGGKGAAPQPGDPQAEAQPQGAEGTPPQDYDPSAIKIVVSIPPQKYLVKRLAGDHAYVVSLLGEHDNLLAAEHLSPQAAAELADAKIFFKIGAPFEKSLNVPATCKVYDMMKDVKLKPFSSHTKYLNGNKSFVGDPYVWMSPGRAVKMLPEVYQALRAVGEEKHYGEYTQNFTRFTRELNSLEGDIQRILLDAMSRDIVVTSPVLGYFCEDFALKQNAYDFAEEGAGPEFIRAAIENKIRVALFYPAAPANLDSRGAELLGGVVDVINPLAEDYVNNLMGIAALIAGRRYEAQ